MSEYTKENFPNCKAFIAQGSEHKFGKQLLFPDNTEILENTLDFFFHVSTCNTHTLASILRVFKSNSSKISNVDFVIIRRDADMAKNDPRNRTTFSISRRLTWNAPCKTSKRTL